MLAPRYSPDPNSRGVHQMIEGFVRYQMRRAYIINLISLQLAGAAAYIPTVIISIWYAENNFCIITPLCYTLSSGIFQIFRIGEDPYLLL